MQRRTGYIISVIMAAVLVPIGFWGMLSTIPAPQIEHSGIVVARYQAGSYFHFIVNESGVLKDVTVPSTTYFAGPSNGQIYEWTTPAPVFPWVFLVMIWTFGPLVISLISEMFGRDSGADTESVYHQSP